MPQGTAARPHHEIGGALVVDAAGVSCSQEGRLMKASQLWDVARE